MDRPSGNNRLDQLDSEVSEVTSLLRNNVEKVLDRGERLDSLQERSEDLHANSMQFNKASQKLRRKMCCKNAKMTACLVAVVVAIIAAVILIILFTVKPWDHNDKPGNQTLHIPPPRLDNGAGKPHKT